MLSLRKTILGEIWGHLWNTSPILSVVHLCDIFNYNLRTSPQNPFHKSEQPLNHNACGYIDKIILNTNTFRTLLMT